MEAEAAASTKFTGIVFLQGRNICDAITQLIRQKIATFIYQSIFDAPHEGNPNLAKLFACFACPITVSVTVRCAPLELQCLSVVPRQEETSCAATAGLIPNLTLTLTVSHG